MHGRGFDFDFENVCKAWPTCFVLEQNRSVCDYFGMYAFYKAVHGQLIPALDEGRTWPSG